jgi:hypothetical protein
LMMSLPRAKPRTLASLPTVVVSILPFEMVKCISLSYLIDGALTNCSLLFVF